MQVSHFIEQTPFFSSTREDVNFVR